MSIKVAIRHYTKYDYEKHISLSPQVIRLRPAPHSRTHIKGYSLNIKPENHFINWQQDPFGNYLARVVFPEKVKYFEIDVEVIADMVVLNPFDFFVDDYASTFPFEYEESLKIQLGPYLDIKEKDPLLLKLVEKAKSLITKDIITVDYLVAINAMINQELKYHVRMEPGVQTCEETLTLGSGSCRDFAWLFVQVLRHLGLASRFASGYLVQLTADEKSLDGPSGPEADFTDLHAWTEVYVPGAGWIGLDSTSGLFAGEGHIPLACTPSPQDAAPISGMAEPAETEFHFENKVTRIKETPRVTKPYSDEQWEKIISVGDQVDQDLVDNDVRLTMGGEPTFVAVDNQDAPEWNSDADGEHKRKLANILFHKLKDEFGKGALMQYGQGKWYPGEPLPRWKLACFWRKDGVPLWHHDHLMADLSKDYKLTSDDAKKFAAELVEQLSIDPKNIRPLYEDPFYFIWQEGNIPVNVDPYKYDLKSPLERQKLSQLLNEGMDKPVGFSIPLEWEYTEQRWMSCRWEFRRKDMFLIPGNSPAGLRLPLDAIAFTPAKEEPLKPESDLFAPVDALPESEKPVKRDPINSERVFKTSLVTEVREGKLFVFFPPVSFIAHYLDLVAAVERTALKLNMPILIEGYDPPADKRIEKMMITPDPGVIEVNIQPAKSWKEVLKNYGTLYEKARETRLISEKFNVDGKHTGTGGGNHITLGGDSPENSPLLRRPDVLRSFITYWQHHPALSYLFSTQFIGPTSQAPRVDEGRDDMLYELELAFQQVPEGKENEIPFWMVDRIFRNLLVDITGNTHRAEFCIDKLHSPDSSSGRLGILEFRGFDMPPHFRMSMVQLLLIRALLSWFWKEPYKHKLVRWGTTLHDKFLLPHYCQKDMKEVVNDLKGAGYGFDISWFDPFFSFRFPFIGELQAEDIHIDMRMAIEPWHVLGEEMSSTGTARYVDSSLERLQVKISGLTDSRYFLLCNGYRIPLKNTGVQGEFVAGIRYRAWQPYSALHPTIGIDTPLVIDLYDSWTKKSVAACQYHVVHPGGRSYDNFPVNSYEAEARRVSRFFDYGHTISQPTVPLAQEQNQSGRYITETKADTDYTVLVEEVNPDFPYTMDLRRYKKREI
ncbi:transglutaminase family protein [Algoriphagus halophytocola]|uniref:Transglutaminase family protein n=1 Tax=Algoriphagus halophytocola TaxID=2991499 RepID=A0ABY6MIH5_9BACT|nr:MULTISPECIES: transglutaminase family protein [unclassified Algoriphagus]UZD23580.1 transglutaminase family protein [Algoriphagus sp. TR-M5]WBL44874.1 transglutaminase family protein [Algoriphagus sp. TR-M9]